MNRFWKTEEQHVIKLLILQKQAPHGYLEKHVGISIRINKLSYSVSGIIFAERM